jgi:2-methylcitrate dehydratase PrpD
MSSTEGLKQISTFVAGASPGADARRRALTAVIDTVGVALAGSSEPAARIVRRALAPQHSGTLAPLHPCTLWGERQRATALDAALSNGTAAHALDFDDMCFVSLAHPSAPLVPAIMAAGELAHASGRAVLDAYVVGFEVQARLGRLMNPRHYQRGWHCTSTLGAMSAAAGAARLLGLDAATTAHALAIAASSASGLKENFGTMIKPLHAGLAARDGMLAALLAREGLTGSDRAIDGPQGFLHAFDAEHEDLARETHGLGSRWEILDTGITVKLYPSCAGTHPSLDAILDLRSGHGFDGDAIDRVEIDVDPIVPTILIYDRPSSALEAKFSMPFCTAAAIVLGHVGIETFADERIRDARITALMPRVTMRVDDAIGVGKPALTEARVRIYLKDGRTLTQDAHGARGYPSNLATDADFEAKFLSCARAALPGPEATDLLRRLRGLETMDSISALFR